MPHGDLKSEVIDKAGRKYHELAGRDENMASHLLKPYRESGQTISSGSLGVGGSE